MGKIESKKWLYAAVSVVFLISGCGSISNAQTATPPTQTEVSVTTATHRVLPNGDTEPVEMVTTDKETVEWLFQKQTDLQKSIAKTLGLNQEDVKIMLAPPALSSEMLCSMVLDIETEIEPERIDQVREDIIDAVMQDSADAKMSKENITITTSKGEIL